MEKVLNLCLAKNSSYTVYHNAEMVLCKDFGVIVTRMMNHD
jgi:hypothetical protein